MSKIELRGILKQVFPAEHLGNEQKTKKVTVTVFRPARTNDFGETIGREDHFEMSTFNDRISEDLLKSLLNKKVKLTAYLGTFEYDDTRSGAKRHGLSLSLSSIEEFTK